MQIFFIHFNDKNNDDDDDNDDLFIDGKLSNSCSQRMVHRLID